MILDVRFAAKETTTGIGAEVNITLKVERAESGLYIASNTMNPALIASGISPQYAILEYLGNFLYSKTIEAEAKR